jgi:hypothetical protein
MESQTPSSPPAARKTLLADDIIVPPGREGEDGRGGATTLVRRRYWLYEKENAITLVVSGYWTGVSRKTGRRWWRWSRDEMMTYYLTSRGNLAYFSKYRDKPSGRHKVGCAIPFKTLKMVFSESDAYRRMIDANHATFHELAVKKFGPITPETIFPGVKYFEIDDPYLTDQLGYPVRGTRGGSSKIKRARAALRQDSPRPYIEVIFGKRNYRKDLLKASLGHSHETLSKLATVWSFLPLDWRIEFLRQGGDPANTTIYRAKNLLILSPALQRRYFLSMPPGQYWMVSDTLRLMGMVAPNAVRRCARQAKSWGELHDSLNAIVVRGQRRKRQRELSAPIQYNPEWNYERLDGAEVEGMRLLLAKTGGEMIGWGDQMGHCIGSYASSAGGSRAFGAIYRENKLIANFQIDRNRLVQLFGKYNQYFEGQEEILAWMSKNNVEIGDAWLARPQDEMGRVLQDAI